MTDYTSRYGNAGDVGAPYQPSSDTSRAAAVDVAKNIEQQRADVHLAIIRAGANGATWDELVDRYDFSPTANGRITELRIGGHIIDSGSRRKTRRGKNATVWIQAPLNSEAQRQRALTDSVPSTESSLPSDQVRTESPTADGEAAANDGAAVTSPACRSCEGRRGRVKIDREPYCCNTCFVTDGADHAKWCSEANRGAA